MTAQTITSFTANPPYGHIGSYPGEFSRLEATASSGLPVTFGTLTPELCRIDANYVAVFLAPGVCIITANQAGNDQYEPATQLELSLTISGSDSMSIRDLVNAQNGTYYGDNNNRCTVFTEDGRQCFLVMDAGTGNESVVPVYLNKDSSNPARFNHLVIDGVMAKPVDEFTGIQTSLYHANGSLKDIQGYKYDDAGNAHLVPVTAIDTETLTPIPSVLDSTLRGKVIWWYAMAAEAAVSLGGVVGFQAQPAMPKFVHSLDFKSTRAHRRIQAKQFTVSFTSQQDTAIKAIRLLQMNSQGNLAYINDTGASYSNTYSNGTSNGGVDTLYAGNDDFIFMNKRAANGIAELSTTHGVTITFPTFVNVDGFEIVGGGNIDYTAPDNVTLSYLGIDGKEAMAARVSGFSLEAQDSVLRMPVHDSASDDIDVGPEIMTYNAQAAIRAKIALKAPLTLAEYMQLSMPTSEAVMLAGLVAAGKTAKEVATINKSLTSRYYNLAAGALLVSHP